LRMKRISEASRGAISASGCVVAVVLSWALLCPLPAAAAPVLVDSVVKQKWTGDFDAMLRRRVMRVLVVNSRMFYFVDRGQQRGIVYDAFKEFENQVNRNLKKGQHPLHVFFIPVARDELLPRLAAGFGDVATGALTITPQRRKLVDFTAPTLYGEVDEIIVTGPESPPFSTLDDLAGREVFVRK